MTDCVLQGAVHTTGGTTMFDDLNAFHLASMADCATPDSLTSAGAELLCSVRDVVAEQLAWQVESNGVTLSEAVAEMRDEAHEVADNAPDVYTHALWAEFVDLGAWQEDIEVFGPMTDMEKGARVALYMIAERLVFALLDTLEEA